MIKKGLIFDMDGTLWDSTDVVAKAWANALKETEYTVTVQDIKNNMGKPVYDIAKILFFKENEEKQKRLMDKCIAYQREELKVSGGILYEGLQETLYALKKDYELYIVSNCPVGYVENFLDFYHFEDLFADYEYIGRTGLRKGDNIKMILERNHLEKALYVGDTEGDYKESLYAGVPFVFAEYGFGAVPDTMHAIKTIKELPEIADKILCNFTVDR